MKYKLSVFLLFLTLFVSNAQSQKNLLHGKILDSDRNILPGASVIIVGTNYGVNANEAGEYLLDQIPTGLIKIKVSFVGFRTLTKDLDLQPGENYFDLILEIEDIKLDAVSVMSQKREQQIIDVPINMSVIDTRFIEDSPEFLYFTIMFLLTAPMELLWNFSTCNRLMF
jgi:hypothetical protein